MIMAMKKAMIDLLIIKRGNIQATYSAKKGMVVIWSEMRPSQGTMLNRMNR